MKWWIWERPSAIHIIYIAGWGCQAPMKRLWGYSYGDKFYGFFHKGMVKWMCDLTQLQNNGRAILPIFLEKKKELMEDWKKRCKQLQDAIESFERTDVRKLSNDELLQLYSTFNKTQLDWWAFGQVAELISYGGEAVLKEKVKDPAHFAALITPTQKSMTNKIEEEFLDLVKLAQAHNPSFQKKLEDHAAKYHWIQNSFGGTKKLTTTFFQKRVQQQLSKGIKEKDDFLITAKKKKMEILGQYKDIEDLVWLLDDFCIFQDERKNIDMRANAVTDGFCKEVSRRNKLPFSLLQYAIPKQITALLQGKKVRLEDLKRQKERCLIIFKDDTDEPEILFGKDALEEQTLSITAHNDEVQGSCANKGLCRGRVRRILTSNDIVKMKQGDILVTTMTTPNFVPAMKKAAAIITDEGGVTCHAAIVSREIDIPCIIGTGNATKVLKNNDLVEVDADHSIVRKVKQ